MENLAEKVAINSEIVDECVGANGLLRKRYPDGYYCDLEAKHACPYKGSEIKLNNQIVRACLYEKKQADQEKKEEKK